jgi:hypothetical protein
MVENPLQLCPIDPPERHTRWRLAVHLALVVFVVLAGCNRASAQESAEGVLPGPPPFRLFRADEDYTYLRDGSPYADDLFDPIKFIPLDQRQSMFLTLGGEIRPRVEFFNSPNWADEREAFYSQRVALHAGVSIGPNIRAFGELYHGLLSKGEREIAEDDDLDLHQGFVDIMFPVSGSRSLKLRVGRQEFAYGSARLVGLREGPNIRRSFDAGRVFYLAPGLRIEAFVGTEVRPSFGAFDNSRDKSMLGWGVFSQFTLPFLTGNNEVYYFGLDVDESRFDDGAGPETRHTIGVRRFGTLGSSFRYNTEVMFQFGNFGGQRITAFAFQTDYYYKLHSLRFRPEPGIKLDYVSGDQRQADNGLNTFNPMFTNPSYFGLLAQITPMNLFDVHPSVRLELTSNVELTVDWDFFWRASKEDGLYAPPRFLSRAGDPSQSRFIGHQAGFEYTHRFGRHVTWIGEASYFLAGPFLAESGDSQNILHLASSFSFKF